MQYLSVKNPQWANIEQTLINCDVNFTHLVDEFVPFTASPEDSEPYGRQIYADCLSGQYGNIASYLPPPPPPPPTADQNKSIAIRLLSETDWVNQPDVIDPNVNPHLLNHADFITYRAALRTIAVNPQPGDLSWPTKPQEQWS
jgi:hypothetical protein